MTTSKLKILMLEDNKLDAELIQRLLTKSDLDCEFRLMMSREAFETSLVDFEPDLVLSDNAMPHFSASEALELLIQKSLHIPFIMVTGTVSEEFAAGIIKAGADDYLLKDRLSRLPAAIATALRQKKNEREKFEADEQIKVNEQKYRSLVERVSDGFMALDVDWNFIYVNQRAEELFNRPEGSLLGKNMWIEFPEAFDKSFYRAYRSAMTTQQNVHLKEYSKAINKWVESSIYPSATGISVFLKDITEQKTAELKARDSEERYGLLIERITDAFIAVDNNFCYTYINKQAAALFKRDVKSSIGKSLWEDFSGAENWAIFQSFREAMEHQKYICITEYVEPLRLWLESHIYPSANGISVFIRDITKRKTAEENLRKSEIRLNEAQAAAHISNWDIDLINNAHFWSDEFYRILGHDKHLVKASDEVFMSLIHPDDFAHVQQTLKNALLPEAPASMNFRITRFDGELRHCYSEWQIEKGTDGSPRRIFGLLQDVTEMKAAAENLKKLEEQILEQKIQEQKAVARAIIMGQEKERNYIGKELHDNVCQILVGAKLYMGMAAVKECALKNLIKYPMELLDTSIEEIRVLSHNLVSPGKNIDLEEMVGEMLYNISLSTKIKMDFEYKVPPDLIADDLKLNIYRILQEQVSNIIKHAQAQHVTISLVATQRYIILVVTDDGVGFNPLTKTNGIGLSNIINRVETFNGTVLVHSEVGNGCEIDIEIPTGL